MTLHELFIKASAFLKSNHVEDPSLEAGLLLSWVLCRELGFIYANPDFIPTPQQIESFRSAVDRRSRHEPFAYITGECEFLALSFKVNPHVLIPRPDTELLAESALKAMGKPTPFFTQPMFELAEKNDYQVLDVGTGSGCLAVSLAKYASCWVDAVDISKDALETAKANAVAHHVSERVRFILADFLTETSGLTPPYDLIVSNPPYIPSGDINGLMASVKDFEPYGALAGGEDGLDFYRALAEKAQEFLAPQGIIAVECGFDQAIKIQALFAQKGMETLLLKDLSGINRVVVSRRQV